jgi:phosphotransferase system HPr-like phosphotransfer protein
VEQLMQNPRLLEATMVRCGQNRTEMKYETECVNARDAVNRLQRAADRERRVQLEAESERKRQALRQTQEAVAAARRRSDEERRRREEDEYLGIFEETPQRQSGEVSSAAGEQRACRRN